MSAQDEATSDHHVSQASDSDSDHATDDTFTFFTKLPKEIQIIIWKAALIPFDKSRLVLLRKKQADRYPSIFIRNQEFLSLNDPVTGRRVRSIQGACKASRDATSEVLAREVSLGHRRFHSRSANENYFTKQIRELHLSLADDLFFVGGIVRSGDYSIPMPDNISQVMSRIMVSQWDMVELLEHYTFVFSLTPPSGSDPAISSILTLVEVFNGVFNERGTLKGHVEQLVVFFVGFNGDDIGYLEDGSLDVEDIQMTPALGEKQFVARDQRKDEQATIILTIWKEWVQRLSVAEDVTAEHRLPELIFATF